MNSLFIGLFLLWYAVMGLFHPPVPQWVLYGLAGIAGLVVLSSLGGWKFPMGKDKSP